MTLRALHAPKLVIIPFMRWARQDWRSGRLHVFNLITAYNGPYEECGVNNDNS